MLVGPDSPESWTDSPNQVDNYSCTHRYPGQAADRVARPFTKGVVSHWVAPVPPPIFRNS